MGVFRNLSNLFSGQPLILRMELSPFGVRLMFLRGGTVISSAELLKVRSAPGVLVKYLSENVKASGNAFLVTLPVARQLSTGLTKHVSESFQLETEAVDSLVETSAPRDFHIHWRFEKTRQVLVRVLKGADGYLGSGWFYRGRSVWRITDAVPSKLTRWL